MSDDTDSRPSYRVYLVHRDAFHWTRDYRRTLCGMTFNSRGYTEASSVGTSRVCATCRDALAAWKEHYGS